MTATALERKGLSTLDSETVATFRAGLRGESIAANDDDYEEARRHRNGLIDRNPGLIVRCAGNADVIACVNFARDNQLLLSIKGGGHNIAGNALNDDGLVIDLSQMKAVHVDPTSSMVLAQGGATWADMDAETQIFGLAVPGGVVSTTGIGGLTLHGGLGHLRRKYGLSIDNLKAVEIVTANGQLQFASEKENPDLFWAVRGAGSNFGVVTGFHFHAHPVGPTVPVAAVFYAADDPSAIIRQWRDFTKQAANDVNALLVAWRVPDDPHFPEELQGSPAIVVAGVWTGDAAEGEEALQPLREMGTALLDLSGPWPWIGLQSGFDALYPSGRKYYWKSAFIDDFSDEAADKIAEAFRSRAGELSSVTLWHLGGAIADVDPTASAWYRRQAPYLFSAESSWDDPDGDAAEVGWARQSHKVLEQFGQGGGYINFAGLGEDKENLLRGAFGPNYDRLLAAKKQYDPDNLFRMNLNIDPS